MYQKIRFQDDISVKTVPILVQEIEKLKFRARKKCCGGGQMLLNAPRLYITVPKGKIIRSFLGEIFRIL